MPTALITGASRRLGLYLCEHLLDDGWQVYGLTRSASSELKSLARDALHIYELERYEPASVERACAELSAEIGELTLLLNNASIYEPDESRADFYEALFFIHMQLPAMLIDAFSGILKRSRGNIVSITDIYADNPNADYNLYCSTKAGLQALTLGCAKKLAPQVRANCIQPGPIKFLSEHDEDYKKQVLAETLLQSEGGFDPIYKTLKFILDNPYLTGTCIKVDGGRSLVRG